jgi:hypothetical protein
MEENVDDEWAAIAEDVGRAREARRQAVGRKEDLVREVSAILFAHDPIGINFETNTDEYDAEAQSIVLRLPEAASAHDLQRICLLEFTRWFSSDMAGTLARYEEIAKEIWGAAERHVG